MRKLIVFLVAGGLLVAGTSSAQILRRTHIITAGAATDTTAVGMADSSSIIGTSQYQQMYLTIKPDRPCRMAVQVRKHGFRDTTAGAVELADSNNVAVWSWRDIDQSGTGAAQDSVQLRSITTAGSALAASDELVINFPDEQVGVTKWGSPRGKYIAILNSNAEWYEARRTSIRWRVLSGSAGVPVIRVSLDGA